MPAPPDWISRLAGALPRGQWRTRFAPAPTGYLHLGHLVNAMHVWGIARAYGGNVVLRIEDHDRTRCRPEFEAALLDDLDWLGLVPDAGTTDSFRLDPHTHGYRQSNQPARYEAALHTLDAAGLLYRCRCSRADIARLVPHAPGEEPRYPGTCRHAQVPATESFAVRAHLATQAYTFDDLRLGQLTQTPAQQCGDLLVRDRHGQFTYQLSVVTDDLAHAIDVVIRGEDLLASTGRQLQLAALLGRVDAPQFLHHALIVHADGTKLSKANRDTALRELRAAGATPAQLFGMAAHRAGMRATDAPIPVDALPELFC
jgi:glutamyl-tRNA synthetase/glutamyl-Q tRNA(Asp) synthetase